MTENLGNYHVTEKKKKYTENALDFTHGNKMDAIVAIKMKRKLTKKV